MNLIIVRYVQPHCQPNAMRSLICIHSQSSLPSPFPTVGHEYEALLLKMIFTTAIGAMSAFR